MYYEFYLDVYFLENLIMNYLILHMTVLVSGHRIRRKRIFLLAALGAAGDCILAVTLVRKWMIPTLFLNMIMGAGMALAGCRVGRKQDMASVISLFFLLSFFMGGIWYILDYYFKLPFAVTAILGYGLGWIFWKIREKQRRRDHFLYQVEASLGERTVCIKGLMDSGNRLVQPGSGRPVQVMELETAKKLLREEQVRELEGLINLKPVDNPTGKFTVIPYHTIGKSQGLMPGMVLDKVCVKHGESVRSTNGVLTAVSKEPVSSRGEYQMILHPQILEQQEDV